MKKNLIILETVMIVFLFCVSSFPLTVVGIERNVLSSSTASSESLSVKINIDPFTTVYEGDVINCSIIGSPQVKYWKINDGEPHMLFYGDDPVIFDPEPTPLNDEYVNLTVYIENEVGNASDSVMIKLKRLFFGDIHWHSRLCDGKFSLDTMYKNAIDDNYLDFAAYSGHAELLDSVDFTSPTSLVRDFVQLLVNRVFHRSEWQTAKDKAIEYYDPGNFTTLLGFEWSAGQWHPGGWFWGANGREDVSHINFYYRDVYPDALKYSAWDKYTFDDIFQAMAEEWDKGHLNVGFPHHPLIFNGFEVNTVNWTFLADGVVNSTDRDKILRGVETYSCWGTAIGMYSGIPITWSYPSNRYYNQTDAWVENGLWKWSEEPRKNRCFVLMAGSDIHQQSRPGSAKSKTWYYSKRGFIPDNPAGILAAYAVHNTREEIWDAMNNCSIYGLQLLKIRANVRLDGQLAYGRWINCTSPLKIRVSVLSTFSGDDHSGKSMCPYGYSPDELEYPVSDIWLVKKDISKGRPWCKVIGHAMPNKNLAVVNFEDPDVQPNDFYYVAIRQKGQQLTGKQSNNLEGTSGDEYMAFIGPIFIDQVQG